MEWRLIPGFPDYEVSEYGDIRRLTPSHTHRKGFILKGNIDQNGYRRYKLSLNGKKVIMKAHRLVCMAFYGLPPEGKEQVAHWDGNRTNNHYTNLRWASQRDNMDDLSRHGRLAGSNNPKAKLTKEKVVAIRREFTQIDKKHGAVANLARKYGISDSAMREMLSGKHWRCV